MSGPPKGTSLSPEEWEAELRFAREEAEKRRKASRMSPEKLAEFNLFLLFIVSATMFCDYE